MDQINIHDLALEISVGAYQWEKHIKQQVLLDVTLHTNTQAPGESDLLQDAIDYAEVAKHIENIASARHFDLIESLAETIAQHLLKDQLCSKVTLTVTKPGAIAKARAVSVTIER